MAPMARKTSTSVIILSGVRIKYLNGRWPWRGLSYLRPILYILKKIMHLIINNWKKCNLTNYYLVVMPDIVRSRALLLFMLTIKPHRMKEKVLNYVWSFDVIQPLTALSTGRKHLRKKYFAAWVMSPPYFLLLVVDKFLGIWLCSKDTKRQRWNSF